MADLYDVTAYLKAQAVAAVYPNGTTQPSVAAMDCLIYEGWPIAAQLDLDMQGQVKSSTGVVSARSGGPRANVSVFPMQGTGVNVYQVLDHVYTIVEPAITTAVEVSDEVITVTGTLSPNEFLTVIIDGAVICSQGGANVAALLAALAAQAVAAGYAATSTSTTLTVPFGHSMAVRQGGQGTLGKVTHRQKHSVMVTVWAPNRVVRNQLAAAIDVLIKANNKPTMPDTSQAILTYNRTNVIDEQQAVTLYRRDLVYEVEYATLQEFPGYTITSATIEIAKPDNTAVATATE